MSWDPLTLVAAVRGVAGIRFEEFESERNILAHDTHFSCHEEGFNGVNEVDQAGNNFWIEDVVGGSNHTYLSIYAEVKP